MRVIQRERTECSGSRARGCAADLCTKRTREGKPFCPDHFAHNDYSKKVLADIEHRANEDKKVGNGETLIVDINLAGITAQEILQQLNIHGPRTQERLCRELSLPTKVLTRYVKALEKQDLVILGKTTRGSVTVDLPRKNRTARSSPCTRSSRSLPRPSSLA